MKCFATGQHFPRREAAEALKARNIPVNISLAAKRQKR
jgi:hypothetical protein